MIINNEFFLPLQTIIDVRFNNSECKYVKGCVYEVYPFKIYEFTQQCLNGECPRRLQNAFPS